MEKRHNRKFFRGVLYGFLVTEVEPDVDTRGVVVYPLVAGWEGPEVEDPIILEEDESIIGVVPAPPGSYVVWGAMSDDSLEQLGFEFPGADRPDWNEILLEREESLKRVRQWKQERRMEIGEDSP